jgi:hypothetical protein
LGGSEIWTLTERDENRANVGIWGFCGDEDVDSGGLGFVIM